MIFLAATPTGENPRRFNLELTNNLEKAGFSVFLSQRDNPDFRKPPYSTMSRDQQRFALFEMHRDLIMACNVFLLILEGRVEDESLTLELGIAYGHRLATGCKRLIIGYQIDQSTYVSNRINPSVKIALDSIAREESTLTQSLSMYKR